MTNTGVESILLIVDNMPLRRAQLIQFLERWALANRLTIAVCDFADIVSLKHPRTCRMVLFGIGAESLLDQRLSAIHRVLAAIHSEAPLVVFGDTPDARNVESALKLGASGYLPASLEADIALAALDFVLAGGSYFPSEILRRINAPPDPPGRARLSLTRASESAPSAPPLPGPGRTNGENSGQIGIDRDVDAGGDMRSSADLTVRQTQVLGCLKHGQSNKQIARDLNMSEATVKVHVRQVMKKLGAVNRTQAAVLASSAAPPTAPAPPAPPSAITVDASLLAYSAARAKRQARTFG